MLNVRIKVFPAIFACINPATPRVLAQLNQQPIKKAVRTPVIFVDSVSIDYAEVSRINKDDIALINVYKDSNAVRLLGPDGRDGIIFLMTKAFARNRYWTFFSAKSAEYAKLVREPGADSTVQYILDNKVLFLDYEGKLALIDNASFKSIRMIDKARLENEYNVRGKTVGVLIEANKPSDWPPGWEF